MRRYGRAASLATIAGLALAIGGAAPGAPTAWADPPGGFSHGHGHDRGDNDRDRGSEHDARRSDERAGHHFQDHDRAAVRDYFVVRGHEARCPPGLAKKHDRCEPPGHARRWVVGQPLPAGVVTYSLPPELVVQLTPPPVGYQYVRVASDILMVAAGTGMVAEAIQDLGR